MSLIMQVLQALLLLCSLQGADAVSMQLSANPIRRVVTMLQMMQKKVTEEGEKEKEMFDKFMCYCKMGASSLGKSIDAAETKIPQVESDVKASAAEKSQLASDITQSKADFAAAKSAMGEAMAIREKSAAAFGKEKSEQEADVAAMGKAITSIEKGASGFLQTSAASVLKRLVVSADLTIESRDALTAFLSEGSKDEREDTYEPASGEVVGILKQMKETMSADAADAAQEEAGSIKDFDALMLAKKRESEALTAEIESKTARVGEVAVAEVNQAQDITDTSKALTEDKKFLGDLDSTCKTKTAEWELRQKTRSEELTALAETVKLLNDDDALDLFKKTLPGSSFMQVQVTNKEVLKQARQTLALGIHDVRLDLITMSLRGRKVSFDKVMTMLDDMVVLLKKEQADDDKKVGYCTKELDKSEDEKKSLDRSEGDLKKTIDDEKESIASLVEELEALEAGIKDLDQSVAQATQNRKAENAAYTESLAANQAALQIIDMAKKRMNKFYNPKLATLQVHKTAPKAEDEAAAVEEETPSFVQIKAHLQEESEDDAAPPPPPAVADAFKKKSGESSGVIAMMDVLMEELKKETLEMEHDEKDGQAEYEKFMADSSDKRAIDAKSIAEKEAGRADTTAKLQQHKEDKKGVIAELYAAWEYAGSLHKECDWLMQNAAVRKEARASEVDALTKAKAVLAGSDA
jgi:hypothetical protein